ncbi:hypothetical protein SGFS_100790 [Streptomyces graminofaciens]|uniref:Uncharacterized protein n=1 Tax=Streptomyces graminofaciens TaxID=68212 RepID=A0ABM7FQD3_9ACTN|nr:hypothetical protein SGFS_100790 [Streptomyces graminofaciens]
MFEILRDRSDMPGLKSIGVTLLDRITGRSGTRQDSTNEIVRLVRGAMTNAIARRCRPSPNPCDWIRHGHCTSPRSGALPLRPCELPQSSPEHVRRIRADEYPPEEIRCIAVCLATIADLHALTLAENSPQNPYFPGILASALDRGMAVLI